MDSLSSLQRAIGWEHAVAVIMSDRLKLVHHEDHTGSTGGAAAGDVDPWRMALNKYIYYYCQRHLPLDILGSLKLTNSLVVHCKSGCFCKNVFHKYRKDVQNQIPTLIQ